jgi:arylsulfatase A-like enzyme/Flp pilus assembly protein TadD
MKTRARTSPAGAGRLLVIALAVAAGVSGPAPFAGDQGDSRNVLLVTLDTTRADRLGCYGCESAATPAIDGLARAGALFERAFAHTPTTLPSHASILLGLTPPAHGVHDNSGFVVPPEPTTIAEWLKGRGYATGAVVGAFPLDSRFGLTRGFDVYDDAYGVQEPGLLEFVERRAEAVIERALAWLDGPAGAGPWFLWVHLFDPHQPWRPPEPFRTRYASAPYDGEVAYADHALAALFEALKARGLDGRTVVVLTGDHGESLGEHGELTHGYFAYNATLHVPLIVAGPGVKPSRVAATVGHIDIFPTVCGLLGVDPPSGLQGRSLLPLLAGKKAPSPPLYFESLNAYYSRGWAPLRGVLDGNEKFIDSPLPELYDLAGDFGETRNLAPGRDLGPQRARFARLLSSLAAAGADKAAAPLDRAAQAKLRSLGYIGATRGASRKTFTAADDLKTLLPFNQRWMEAVLLRDQGRIDEGIKLLREVVAARPDFDLAYTALASFLKERGSFDEAVATLRDAAEKNPDNFTVLTAYGIILVEAGRFEESVGILRDALEIYDDDPEAWNYLGVALWNKGDYAESRKAYAKALALDANDAIVISNLGTLELSTFLGTREADALAAAVADFRKAVGLDPAYAPAYNGLGAALRMSGDADGAIAAWAKAVEIRPDFGYALHNLGLTLLERGEKEKALVHLTRYRDLFASSLDEAERRALDDAIARCRDERPAAAAALFALEAASLLRSPRHLRRQGS